MVTRNKARIEILEFVVTHCTYKYFGGNSFSIPDKDKAFYVTYGDKQEPEIGSLCILQSAPTTKWYLSWLKEIKSDDSRFATKFLLESIEDGSLCWWENIGIGSLPKSQTDQFKMWKWTDDQFDFKDKWFNCCYKKRDAYVKKPLLPEFNEDGSVTIGLRTIFGLDDERPTITFPNYKKVKIKDMLAFYDTHVKK